MDNDDEGGPYNDPDVEHDTPAPRGQTSNPEVITISDDESDNSEIDEL